MSLIGECLALPDVRRRTKLHDYLDEVGVHTDEPAMQDMVINSFITSMK